MNIKKLKILKKNILFQQVIKLLFEQIIYKLYKEFENILSDCNKKSKEIKKAEEELKRISLHDYEEYINFV